MSAKPLIVPYDGTDSGGTSEDESESISPSATSDVTTGKNEVGGGVGTKVIEPSSNSTTTQLHGEGLPASNNSNPSHCHEVPKSNFRTRIIYRTGRGPNRGVTTGQRRGRRPMDDPGVVEDAILRYRDRIIVNGNVVPRTNKVWQTIREENNFLSSTNALHTFVICNRGVSRGGILSTLGLKSPHTSEDSHSDESVDSHSTVSGSSASETDEDVQRFTITIPKDKWKLMHPKEKTYKRGDINRGKQERNYHVLPKGVWGDILSNALRHDTRLPCSWSFKRYYVAISSEAEHYIKVHGSCKCGAALTAACGNPLDYDPYKEGLMLEISVTGVACHGDHSTIRKRPLSGDRRAEVASRMLKENLSASYVRKEMAAEEMELFEVEPGTLPRLNTLRKAKSDLNIKQRLDADPVAAIGMLKYTPKHGPSILEIGSDPFFVHFITPDQLRVYKAYAAKSYHRVIIDATGGIVDKLQRPGGKTSGHIFLYQAVISVPGEHEGQVPVAQMLSERHNGNAVAYFLSEWRRLGAPVPNEVVCDFSATFLYALSRSLADVASTNDYINQTFRYMVDPQQAKPRCLLRIDIAHLIKQIASWKCVKNMSTRCKEFFMRCFTLLVFAKDVSSFRSILLAIFVTTSNETEGRSADTGEDTPCEVRKQWLLQLIGMHKGEIDKALERSDTTSENDSFQEILHAEEEAASTGQIKDWINGVYYESQREENVILDGDRDNIMFNLAFRDELLKLCCKFPLWCHAAAIAFGSPYERAIGAYVESLINDLKNRLIPRKCRVDLYLQRYLEVIDGTMKLVSGLRFFHQNLSCVECLTGKSVDQNSQLTCVQCGLRIHSNENCSRLVGNTNTRICLACLPESMERILLEQTECNEEDDLHSSAQGVFQTAGKDIYHDVASDAEVRTEVIPANFMAPDKLQDLCYTSGTEKRTTFRQSNNAHNRRNSDTQSRELDESTFFPLAVTSCPVCESGNEPGTDSAHKCVKCGAGVHALDSCSSPAPGQDEGHGQGRICRKCSHGKSVQAPNDGAATSTSTRLVASRGRSCKPSAHVSSSRISLNQSRPVSLQRTSTIPLGGTPNTREGTKSTGNTPGKGNQAQQRTNPTSREAEQSTSLPLAVTSCPVCESGNEPGTDSAHKCVRCGAGVHALDSCSSPAPGQDEGHGQGRICRKCSHDDIVQERNVRVSQASPLHRSSGRGSKCRQPSVRPPSVRKSRNGSVSLSSSESSSCPLESTRNRDNFVGTANVDDVSQSTGDKPAHHIVQPAYPSRPRRKTATQLLTKHCSVCESGSEPGADSVSKCVKCGADVHALVTCSSPTAGEADGHGRICLKCSDGQVAPTKSGSGILVLRKEIALDVPHTKQHEKKRVTFAAPSCAVCARSIALEAGKAQKCVKCSAAIHVVGTCSLPVPEGEEEQGRICVLCISDPVHEMQEVENWKGKACSTVRRRESHFIKPYPELGVLLEAPNKVRIGLLRNGGTHVLTSVRLHKETISLQNTCGVDALVQVLAASICDSREFRIFVEDYVSVFPEDSSVLHLAHHVATKGVSHAAYRMRAKLLRDKLPVTELPSKVLSVDCASTAAHLSKVLGMPPSVIQVQKCSSPFCPSGGRVVKNISLFGVSLDGVPSGIESLQSAVISNMPDTLSSCVLPFADGAVESIPSEFLTNNPPQPTLSSFVLCGGVKRSLNHVPQHLLLGISGISSTRCSSFDGTIETPVSCVLGDIPKNLTLFGKSYELRGVIGFKAPTGGQLRVLGHIVAYCRRVDGKWELYDDLATKMSPVRSVTEVDIDVLLYVRNDAKRTL